MTKEQSETINAIVQELSHAMALLDSLQAELEEAVEKVESDETKMQLEETIESLESVNSSIDEALITLNTIEDDEDEAS